MAGYAARWQACRALARRWSVQQEATPLILAPVRLRQPFAPDDDLRSTDAVREILASMRVVVAVNLLGLPAVAVPAGLDETGVPLGVQLIGSHFREDLCLGAAEAVERGVGSVAPIDPRAAG